MRPGPSVSICGGVAAEGLTLGEREGSPSWSWVLFSSENDDLLPTSKG